MYLCTCVRVYLCTCIAADDDEDDKQAEDFETKVVFDEAEIYPGEEEG